MVSFYYAVRLVNVSSIFRILVRLPNPIQFTRSLTVRAVMSQERSLNERADHRHSRYFRRRRSRRPAT